MKRRLSNGRKKRSWVWKYFEDDKEKEKNDSDKSYRWVKCTIEDCKNPVVKMKGFSTSNLAYHLKNAHSITPDKDEESSDDIPEAKHDIFSKADQDLLDLKLYVHLVQLTFLIYRVKFISASHSALALVDSDEFSQFVGCLNSKYILPSRKKLRDMILEDYEKMKEKVPLHKFLASTLLIKIDEKHHSSNQII